MDSVNKKLEEDYQQLFILLKKKYKKQIFDEDTNSFLKLIQRGIWLLQVFSNSIEDSIEQTIVNSLSLFEVILIKNHTLINYLGRNTIENIVFLLSKDNKEINAESAVEKMFTTLFHTSNPKIENYLKKIKGRYKTYCEIVHKKDKVHNESITNGMKRYWELCTNEKVKEALDNYFLSIYECITIFYLENMDKFDKMSDEDKIIIEVLLPEDYRKEIKNIID